jgi:ubiquinone/menaquinone biosynthesis C-methylase UbiE
MREAYRFYQSTLPFLARMRPLTERKYLDFGTGWGRFPRTFLKAVEPGNIHAIDVDPAMISVCKSTFSFGNFEVCSPLPPSSFADGTFDFITAYSVFSHLSEDAANRWVHEFARILRPGGIVAFTTQGSNFISLCAYFRMQQHVANPWHAQLAACFTDQEACYADYDAGKFLFAATGAEGSEVRNASFYGEALIPAGYMIEKWGGMFDLLTFFHDESILPQAFAVLRRK